MFFKNLYSGRHKPCSQIVYYDRLEVTKTLQLTVGKSELWIFYSTSSRPVTCTINIVTIVNYAASGVIYDCSGAPIL
jgi:hypothetical protein